MEKQSGLTWTCPHCYKLFSPNYKYKSHLKRCLCFKPISDHHQQALVEIKDELKSELTNMFRDAIEELKQEIKLNTYQPSLANTSANTLSTKPLFKKNIGNLFN